jgi:hypothetical protein
MPLDKYRLAAGGKSLTLSQWGITKASFTEGVPGSGDNLTISLPNSPNVSDVFGSLQPISLYSLANPSVPLLCFQGERVNPSASINSKLQDRTYRFEGLANRLKKVIYMHPWLLWDDTSVFPGWAQENGNNPLLPSNNGVAFNGLSQHFLSRCIIGRNNGVGPGGLSKVNLGQQMAMVLNYALGNEAGNFPSFGYSNPDTSEAIAMNWQGANMPTNWFPDSEVIDLDCDGLLHQLFQWCPHMNFRVNYATTPPTLILNDTTSTGFGPVVNKLLGTDFHIEDIQFSKRFDLLVPKCVVYTLFGNTQIDPNDLSSFINFNNLLEDTSDYSSNGGFGVVRVTVVTRGPIIHTIGGVNFTDQGEVDPSPGLANSLHKAYTTLYPEGTLKLHGQDCDWSFHAGQLLQLVGPSLSDCALPPILSIERDLVEGTTNVKFGPPTQMGLKGRVAMLQGNRLVKGINSNAGSAQFGTQKPGQTDSPVPPGTNSTILMNLGALDGSVGQVRIYAKQT